jgi:hypothetical protein
MCRSRLGADVDTTGLERPQIGDQPALHVEPEGAGHPGGSARQLRCGSGRVCDGVGGNGGQRV